MVKMKSTSSDDISASEELLDDSSKKVSDKTQSRTRDIEQERSLRITIRVPNRSMAGKRSRRRRIEAIESISGSELDELGSSNEIDETIMEESVDTEESEGFTEGLGGRSGGMKEKAGEQIRLTKRQRARMDEEVGETNDLVQLPESKYFMRKKREYFKGK